LITNNCRENCTKQIRKLSVSSCSFRRTLENELKQTHSQNVSQGKS